jgi:glycosyltransferase involved in cell wall biosynthesis
LRSFLFRLAKRVLKAILPNNAYKKLSNWFNRIYYSKIDTTGLQKSNINELPQGVNLFVHYFNNSAGVVARLLQQALDASEIPYNIIDMANPEKSKIELCNKKLYNTNLIACHAASNILPALHILGINLNQHFNIAHWAWELPQLPDVFCPALNIFHEIWTISSFCTSAAEKKSKVPVLTIPLCSDRNQAIIENGRTHFNIDDDVFLFTLAYDCDSYVSRKNPHAAVKAFMKAFTPEDSHVGLVVKLTSSDKYRKQKEELQESLSSYPHIYFVERFLSDEEMRTLIQISDAYISLHRSEGFGLIPLEAMAMGTPVVSTAWSGNMEYMNHMNAALVGYDFIPVNGDYVGSVPGDGLFWANPDVDEAASHMIRMVNDKEWRESLIKNGLHTVNECFNVTHMSKAMRSRMEFLDLI